ncbi:MAG: transposase [Rhodanobacter sp.]
MAGAATSGHGHPAAALDRLRQIISAYLEGIVTKAIHRLDTSAFSGMNNPMKIIKRMACGYRDSACFFLNIRAAFAGRRDESFKHVQAHDARAHILL